ncbi:hypothetical protein RB199_23085 [Streptomyces libani]|uniref:hypothetical protein n=1 Tax=Streptomyces nigrescens TaxID=1920 RepID=UPI00224E1D92|nr:hypothetical protein [Streptomyces libani]MCX5444351.1 hypothetical protein [Streptomyces libani]
MPADASSPIPPALDQLRKQPEPRPEEIPGLLERLAEVPAPRDPRGVRHALAAVLALSVSVDDKSLRGAAKATVRRSPAPGTRQRLGRG